MNYLIRIERLIFWKKIIIQKQKHINVVTNWVPNEISSTLARRYIRRGLSVKYMLDDNVVEYIRQNKLYNIDSSWVTFSCFYLLFYSFGYSSNWFSFSQNRKYIRTPNQTQINKSLTPNHNNDNYIIKTEIDQHDCESMDECDCSPAKCSNALDNNSKATNDGNHSSNARTKLLNNKSTRRPRQAIQIRTDMNGTRTIDHEDEVGECKISTITLSSDNKSLEKKIEYISDNQLDKLTNGIDAIAHVNHNDYDHDKTIVRPAFDTLSAECLLTTTKRSHNDLIQFVFTSHGIRVISDKEYVVWIKFNLWPNTIFAQIFDDSRRVRFYNQFDNRTEKKIRRQNFKSNGIHIVPNKFLKETPRALANFIHEIKYPWVVCPFLNSNESHTINRYL